MSKTFNKGDVVYDIHGREGLYVGRVGQGHAVEPSYEHDEDEDEGPYYGDVQTWRDVYTKPPTEKLHAEVAEIEAQISAAQQRLKLTRDAQRGEDEQFKARAAVRKQFAQLQTLDDFIAGKITHIVVQEDYSSRVAIHEAAKLLQSTEDRYDRKLRMLSLYGDSKGNLAWNLSRYSDGSGSNSQSGHCWPAVSLEDARQKASEWLDERYTEWRKEDWNSKSRASEYAACAASFGFSVPDDVAAHAAKIDAAYKANRIESARKDLEKAKAALALLEK